MYSIELKCTNSNCSKFPNSKLQSWDNTNSFHDRKCNESIKYLISSRLRHSYSRLRSLRYRLIFRVYLLVINDRKFYVSISNSKQLYSLWLKYILHFNVHTTTSSALKWIFRNRFSFRNRNSRSKLFFKFMSSSLVTTKWNLNFTHNMLIC